MGALRAHLRPYAPAYRIIQRYYRWGVRLYQAATDPRDRARLLLFWLCLLRRDLVRGVTGRVWPEDRAITLYGAHFVVDLAPTEIFTIEEIYRDRCYDVCPDFIARPGWTVVDIGANVGMFSLLNARRGAVVYAFEPNPPCVRRLRDALTRNRLDGRVMCVQVAIGAHEGQGALVLAQDTTTMGRVRALQSEAAWAPPRTQTYRTPPPVERPVHIMTLDQALAERPLHRIDLLKIDTEGGERDVLRGAAETLALTAHVIVECHTAHLERDVHAALDTSGFTLAHRDPHPRIAGIATLFYRR